MLTFPVTFFGASGPRVAFGSVSTLGTSSSSFSFTSMSLSDAAPDRLIVVGITMGTTGTNFGITGVTVAGNAATSVVSLDANDTILKAKGALYQVAVPTGTSDTVAVTFSGSVAQCQVVTWALYNLTSTTPSTTNSNGAIDANTASFNINIPATGILLGTGVFFSGGAGTQTLSGLTTIDASEGSTLRQWGRHQAAAAETGRALSFSGTGGVNSARVLVGATWA